MTAIYNRATLGRRLTSTEADAIMSAFAVRTLTLSVPTVANQDYVLHLKMSHGGTISETVTQATSGTATCTWKVNSTALATTNAASSTLVAQTQSQAFVAGDVIKVTISANSSCLGLNAVVKYTRTLD